MYKLAQVFFWSARNVMLQEVSFEFYHKYLRLFDSGPDGLRQGRAMAQAAMQCSFCRF